MTAFSLTLDRVTCTLPDGRVLFSDISTHIDTTPTGLVGRNGVGKSVLARVLAGQHAPSAGQVQRTGRVHLLAQHSGAPPGSIAALAGVAPLLDALARIEAGSVDPADFTAVGERWNIREQLQAQWQQLGLPTLDPARPAASLSGGQAMQVALGGALLSQADGLILDEPSNHLDRAGRQWLAEQLQARKQGLILVSHDRLLLQQVERIVELSPQGLRSYGGNHAFYAQARAGERAAAEALLQQRRNERRKGEQTLREQRQRLEQRSARGNRDAANANQAPILLGLQRQRAEASQGKARAQLDQRQLRLHDAVREAQADSEAAAPVLLLPSVQTSGPEWVVRSSHLQLPHVAPALRALDFNLRRGERVAITGANGVGKSTLLKVLAGQLPALAGEVNVQVPAALLDQQLQLLPAHSSVLEALRLRNPGSAEGELRSRLALLGLDANQVQLPSAQLSGGQRLKAGLACALYADPPAQLLLLDEPGNHLDLDALTALEELLRQYQGSLLLVSHDEALLQAIGISARLHAGEDGWHWQRD